MTTVIVGVGCVALLQLIAAGTVANVDGARTTTAVNLGRNVRERTLRFRYDDLRGLNGRVYQPPIDSRGNLMTEMTEWSQSVSVTPVNPDRLTMPILDTDPDALRVRVTVKRNGETVTEVNWYCFDAR